MVNTNDFRRYSYSYDAAYALMRLIKPVPPQHPMFTGAKKESASLL